MITASENSPLILLGGSFDPIHIGRERLLCAVRDALSAHNVLAQAAFVPAAQNPLKGTKPTCNQDRLAMVNLVANRIGAEVLDLELHRQGVSYSVDTMGQLRQSLGPVRPLLLCMGADSLASFERWRDWQTLVKQVHLVVVNRPGYKIEVPASLLAQLTYGVQSIEQLADTPAGALAQIEMPNCDLSSTAIRKAVSRGQAISELVSSDVAAYIKQHQLYLGS